MVCLMLSLLVPKKNIEPIINALNIWMRVRSANDSPPEGVALAWLIAMKAKANWTA